MPTITLKNIPDRLYAQLKALARIRHRSLNKEIIYSLEKSLAESELHPLEIRSRAKILRESIACPVDLTAIENAISNQTS